MKLAEFKSATPPAPGPSPAAVEEVSEPSEEPQYFTAVTPSGIEVAYSPAPRRHYKLRQAGTKTWGDLGPHEWVEVPSVTTVLGVLDKSGPLTWWGMKVGVEGVMKLVENDDLFYRGHRKPHCLITTEPAPATVQDIVDLMVHRKLTVNHVMDKAADRGVNVHGVLEEWLPGKEVSWSDRPEHEQGYVKGLADFLLQIEDAVEFGSLDMELMVGSLEHQYAGRFDLVLTLSKPVEVVTRCYPVKADKVETIPAGKYLCDLKTSKRTYDSQHLQLQAYELAAIECGYPPTDYQAVIHVTAEGKYEFVMNPGWTAEDFLAVRRCYSVIHERDKLKKEREIEADLRNELDAREV